MAESDQKKALRERYRRERRERFMDHNFLNLVNTPEIQSAHTVGSYYSINDEPSTFALNLELIKQGKRILLPSISGQELLWRVWDGSSLELSKKIPEARGEIVEVSECDALLVPALRVDRRGFRLGQGGGYFDRALVSAQCWTCALVHPDEISSQDLPTDEWDIAVRAFATPHMVTRIRG